MSTHSMGVLSHRPGAVVLLLAVAGLPVTWHVADAKVAEFLRNICEKNRELRNITVRHTLPAQ